VKAQFIEPSLQFDASTSDRLREDRGTGSKGEQTSQGSWARSLAPCLRGVQFYAFEIRVQHQS
jgi:hypothetical protein